MGINFYGKVIDYVTSLPIPGVKVAVAWNDLSPSGTSKKTLTTDDQGLFQLLDERGKLLVISSLEKEGVTRSVVDSQFSFGYSDFWAENFHRPDRDSPVIFRMRATTGTAGLLFREGEMDFSRQGFGTLAVDEKNQLRIDLLANDASGENWAAAVSVTEGGAQISTEEFPFMAPEDGYLAKLLLDKKSQKPGGWPGLYDGGQIYFKTVNGIYGRVTLKTVSGKHFMRYSLVINPEAGKRNLEMAQDSKK